MKESLNAAFVFFAVACAALVALAGPALAEDERRFDVENFDRIDISAGVKLIAEVGAPQSVIVQTDAGDFSDFEIAVRNGALHLSRDTNRLRWHSKKSAYKVFVTAPALRALDASSGAHATIAGIDGARFVVDLSSGAYARLDGACEACAIDISSGARLDAAELACETASIDVSSGGAGELSASRAVMADASSGGRFTVYGNPARVSIDKSSGGRVYLASAPQ